ncbi:MAG: PocR ligand-binding domain-containing protein, partial [Treponema sp.]|nr:PocR ligand-binding domain-containing protein [Treponema sp.]
MKEKDLVHNGTSDDGPGISRERKVISVYVQSTGSNVQVFDGYFQPVETDEESSTEQNICKYCNAGERGSVNCQQMHVGEIQEAGNQGKPHIYQCKLGLLFWVSPIYSDGKISGALRGSGYMIPEAGDPGAFCNGTIAPDEFAGRVSAYPVADMERIQSLAEMLLLCSESLSVGNGNRHEALRLRHEQQNSLSVLVEELKEKYP